jgi:hypothetical protein
MDRCGNPRPYFLPHFLGAKAQTFDFLVGVIDPGQMPGFFFVQVRTTANGYTRKGRNLRVKVSREEMERLGRYPAPAYVVGIDEPSMPVRGYMVSANDPTQGGLTSLSTRYPLNPTNLALLWNEVKGFWAGQTKALTHSVFAI